MQANTLTITIPDGVGTKEVVFTRQRELADRTEYEAESSVPESRYLLTLYRAEAKRNGESRGSRKSAFKFTVDVSVTNASGGSIVLPYINECSHSMPLGTPPAVITEVSALCSALYAQTGEADLVPSLISKIRI